MAKAKKFGAIKNAQTGETLVQLIGPGAEDDPLSVCLRMLTHQLQQRHPDLTVGGFFGGPFGYGVDFKNDVFEMHPDWQGDCTCGATEPIHAEACRALFDAWLTARNDYGIVPSTDAEIEAEVTKSRAMGFSEQWARLSSCARPFSFARTEEYERAHPRPACVCEAKNWVERDTHDPSCRLEQHCFAFFPTGFVMDWYKYIGRDNEIHEQGSLITVADMIEACLRSIDGPSLDVAFAAYVAAEKDRAEQSAAFMSAMFTGPSTL